MSSVPPKGIVSIIDDDDVRDSTRVLLEVFGLDVRDYHYAEAFLADSITEADCLLVDQHMPGMTGLDLIRWLRNQGRNVPAILITGRPDSALRLSGTKAGAFALLEKPVDGEALLDSVGNAMVAGAAEAQV